MNPFIIIVPVFLLSLVGLQVYASGKAHTAIEEWYRSKGW
jgi:hypothetical protein